MCEREGVHLVESPGGGRRGEQSLAVTDRDAWGGFGVVPAAPSDAVQA